MILKKCTWLPLVLGLLLGSGCVALEKHRPPPKEKPPEKRVEKEEKPAQVKVISKPRISPPLPGPQEKAPAPEEKQQEPSTQEKPAPEEKSQKPADEEPPSLPNGPSQMSNQEILDSALDFYQVSDDFWEQGDLDNALAALDKAYALILNVNEDNDPEVLQQKEDLRITISKRIVEVYASRYTVANGRHKAIPLLMNRHVERALSLFKGRERKFFLDSYRRSGRYRPYIVKALREKGLPEELSWLPLIESGFKVRAFSSARALGLWQFIASTGYKFGLNRDPWIDERMDPEKSTWAAIAYLTELHQIFGDWTTALAAYNCGERRVLNRIRSQRINYLDNFWDLYRRLPRETAFYVPKFLAVLHILSDPEKHGIVLPPVDSEIRTEEVTINKQMHLKTIARRLNIDYETIKDINAELRQYLTPNSPYQLKVPKGQAEVLLAKLKDIPVWRPPVPEYITHRVRSGDSLSKIAGRYKTSVRAVMAANGLKKSHYLKVGWKLKIPTKKGLVTSSRRPPVDVKKPKKKFLEYEVKKGDSLWTIANKYKTTTKAIRSLNRLRNSRLSIGQVLMISPDLSTPRPTSTKKYRVRKGDSPYLIAKRYGMSLSRFLKLNKLTPRSTIFPGQSLLVTAR